MSLDDSTTRPWLRGSLHTGSAAEPSEVSQRAVPTPEVPLPFTTMDVDHFMPWVRYPNNAVENLVLAHNHCNRSRNAL